MNKARKKFILWAMAAIFVLLTVLLGIINGVSCTMAAEDADQITLRLARERGAFETRQTEEEGRGAHDGLLAVHHVTEHMGGMNGT